MVGLRGFEPPTFGPPDRRANQAAPQPVWLNHHRSQTRHAPPLQPLEKMDFLELIQD